MFSLINSGDIYSDKFISLPLEQIDLIKSSASLSPSPRVLFLLQRPAVEARAGQGRSARRAARFRDVRRQPRRAVRRSGAPTYAPGSARSPRGGHVAGREHAPSRDRSVDVLRFVLFDLRRQERPRAAQRAASQRSLQGRDRDAEHVERRHRRRQRRQRQQLGHCRSRDGQDPPRPKRGRGRDRGDVDHAHDDHNQHDHVDQHQQQQPTGQPRRRSQPLAGAVSARSATGPRRSSQRQLELDALDARVRPLQRRQDYALDRK